MEPLTTVQEELYVWLVQYIQEHQFAPSIRQMMHAMNLRSPAPVQSRLEHLKKKGYIDWSDGQARTIRILHQAPKGIPLQGVITAGAAVDAFNEINEYIDISPALLKPKDYALRVAGDSMIDAHIVEGDVVIMRPVDDPKGIKNGTIVAALVDQDKTTLKYFHRRSNTITLKPANPNYEPIKVSAENIQVQGILVGVWREV